MTQKDLNIINDFLDRLKNLPDILHLRASEIGYKLTEDDKKLLLDTYGKLDDILKEVAAFINVKFPGRQDFIYSWNKIDFDTKIGNFKIVTTDREHIKREWKKGLLDLESLLKSLKNELVLMVDDESDKDKYSNNIRSTNLSGNIIYNENSNIGNQSLLDNAFESPTTQKISKQTDKKPKSSLIEILSWITAIIASIIAIYEFLIK
jgi:hypothetical protein